MGMVPVAPSRKSALLEGDKKEKGFMERPMLPRLKRAESAKRNMLTVMSDLVM